MFYCYKITNLKNDKVYIGKTNRPEARWREHKSSATNSKSGRKYVCPIASAIRKYGVENFKFEMIAAYKTEQEANKGEVYYIDLYRSNINVFGKEFGYNLTEGGEGVSGMKRTPETRAKMSASHMGLRPSQESLEKRSKSRTGILHSQKTKNQLREIFSGENSSNAKITWNIVFKIRQEYEGEDVTQTQLAQKYGLSISNISSIVRYKSWRI
jgi:group I intron endonuclease